MRITTDTAPESVAPGAREGTERLPWKTSEPLGGLRAPNREDLPRSCRDVVDRATSNKSINDAAGRLLEEPKGCPGDAGRRRKTGEVEANAFPPKLSLGAAPLTKESSVGPVQAPAPAPPPRLLQPLS